MRHTFVAALGAAALAGAALAPDADAQEGTVRLAYVEWSDAVVATNIVKTVLEQQGYEVEAIPLAAAAMWQAVAVGEADAMVAAWLPVTHAAYNDKLGDQVDNLGPNVEGARLGWAVPSYVDVSSIPELNDHADMFDGKVIGIDPGAGLMRASEEAMETYDLSDLDLVEGSDATMVAALADAIEREQPIVVTAWTPHWMFAQWDLKYLEDPEGVLGGEETVNTVARQGLEEDMPEAYAILDKFHLSLEDEQTVMVWNEEEGADPAETAARWVEENADKVEAWLP